MSQTSVSHCSVPVTYGEIFGGIIPPQQNPNSASSELKAYIERSGSPQNAIIVASAALAGGNFLDGIPYGTVNDIQLAGLQIAADCRTRHEEGEAEKRRHTHEHDKKTVEAEHQERDHRDHRDHAEVKDPFHGKVLAQDVGDTSHSQHSSSRTSQPGPNLLAAALAQVQAIGAGLKMHLSGVDTPHLGEGHTPAIHFASSRAPETPQVDTTPTVSANAQGLPAIGLDMSVPTRMDLASYLSTGQALQPWQLPQTAPQGMSLSLAA